MKINKVISGATAPKNPSTPSDCIEDVLLLFKKMYTKEGTVGACSINCVGVEYVGEELTENDVINE